MTVPHGDRNAHVTVTEVIHGRGKMQRGDAVIPVSGFTLKRHDDRSQGWDVRAFLADEDPDLIRSMIAPGPEALRLSGHTDGNVPLLVEQFYWSRRVRNRIHGDAFELLLGDMDIPEVPERQFVLLGTSPTRLFRPEVRGLVLDWTGEIRTVGERIRTRPVRWRARAGIARLSQRYDYLDGELEDEKALLRVPRSKIAIRILPDSRTDRPGALLKEAVEDVHDLLAVISFLDRRPVRVTEGFVSSRWFRSQDPGFGELEWWRSVRVPGFRGREWEPLIASANLNSGILRDATAAIRSSEGRDGLIAATVNLNMVPNEEVIDRSFVSAFLALEGVVAALAGERKWSMSLSATDFRDLRKTVCTGIEGFASERDMPSETVDLLKRKVPELRRRPFVDQVMKVVDELEVDTSGIWPKSVDLEAGLRSAYRRRSRYIHAGILPPPKQAVVDGLRVHAISERILWRFLCVPDEVMFPRAYEHLEGIERLERGDA